MRQPNDALAALVAETGWSWAGLARRVNDLGAAAGIPLSYDYTAVNRWIKKGERPRIGGVPDLIAQALSEKLGRRVTPGDFGMPVGPALLARSLEYSPELPTTLDILADLGHADVKRRSLLAAAPFVLGAFAGPSRDWLLAMLDETDADRGPRRVGMAQVEGIREMFRHFQEIDVMRGGGHGRVALVEYMNSYVMPLVRGRHDEPVQTALYEAAAEQAYLVGWMAYDDGLHGLAQRYLIQSLRLAQASGNPVLGAHVLAGMSDQANLLGHPREAVALAQSGRRAITATDSPACLADLHVLEARAHAALGDKAKATSNAILAETFFARVVPANEPEWARFIDPAYVFGEAAQVFRDIGDLDQVQRFGAESADSAATQRRARRGALSHAALAVAELAGGNPDAAAHRGRHVVDLAARVDSSRCLEAVRDLQRRLAPYSRLDVVADFHEHARVVLGVAA